MQYNNKQQFLAQGRRNHKNPWMHNFDQGGVHKLVYFV